MANLIDYGTCTLEDDGCTTCGDIAVPVRVIRPLADEVALCEDRVGREAEIATAFTPGASADDVLLVHMGVAIASIPRGEA